MGKIKLFWGLLLMAMCACGANAQGQAVLNTTNWLKKIPNLVDFEVDNLGNIYGVSANGQVKKWSARFDSVGVFNDIRQYGPLTQIDVSNPLRILLFYKDFSTLVILDRFLNQRTNLDFRNAGILQAGCIGQSFDNQIWVFDEWDNRLKKIDETGKVLVESPDFRILYEQPPKPQILIDAHQMLLAYDSTRGLLTMDYYGAPRNLFAFKGWKNVHTTKGGLLATDSNGLVFWQPGKLETIQQKMAANGLLAQKIRVVAGRIFVLQPNGELTIQTFEGLPPGY